MEPQAAAPATAAPREAGARPARGRRIDWLPVTGPVALLIVWQLTVWSGAISPILLPSPWDTATTLVREMVVGGLMWDFLATVERTFLAFLIATVVGLPLGVLLGSRERAYRSIEFLIDFFRSTPASALIPLFLLIFGISDINKVAIAAFSAFLIIVFNSAYGVLNARKQRLMAAWVMGASRWRIFWDVLVWESLQASFVGLRSAVSMALVIVVIAEMFIGSTDGLGHRIIYAQQVLQVQLMYGAIICTGVLGYGLNVLFLLAESRIVHWRGR